MASRLPTTAWQLRSFEALAALRRVRGFDVGVVDTTMSGAFIAELRAAGLPWLFDATDVDHLLVGQISRHLADPVTRARFLVDALKFRNLEMRLLAESAVSVAVSAEDARVFESMNSRARVSVCPNGVDLEYARFVDHTKPKGARLVMTGTLAYYPNLDASRWFIHAVMPIVRNQVPTATLTLVGGPVPSELSNVDADATGVHVVGPVPDVRPFLDEADLFVIPLRIGGGTRIKAVEALASGLPIVSTRLGVTGLGIVDHDLAVLAETASDFAVAITRALDDVELRRRLVSEGRRYAERSFDFDRIAHEFRASLEAAVEHKMS